MKGHIKVSRYCELVVLFLALAHPLIAQQPRQAVVKNLQEPSPKNTAGTPPGNKTLLGVSFVMTAGQPGESNYPNPFGVEFEFMIRPTKRHESTPYYIGINFNLTGSHTTTPMVIPGTSNATLDSHFNTMFLGMSQYYFLRTNSNTKPFLELDLGVRIMRNFETTHYEYLYPLLPWGGSDEVVNKSESQFSAGLKFGYFFQVLGSRGIYIKAGINTGGRFEICKNGSVVSTVLHEYTFEPATTGAIFLSMHVGFML